MEPREFVDSELILVRKMFEIQKVIHPMIVLIKEDSRYAVPVELPDNARKDIIAQGIKDLVKKAEPDVVVFLAEAWTTVMRNMADRFLHSVERHEIIHVLIEFKTGEKYGCAAKIIREKGEPRLEKFDVVPNDISMGRFCDFFPIGRLN